MTRSTKAKSVYTELLSRKSSQSVRNSELREHVKRQSKKLPGSIGASLCRGNESLNTLAVEMIVDNRKRKLQQLFLQKALLATVLKPTINVDNAELPGRQARHSHPLSFLLLLFGLWGLQATPTLAGERRGGKKRMRDRKVARMRETNEKGRSQ